MYASATAGTSTTRQAARHVVEAEYVQQMVGSVDGELREQGCRNKKIGFADAVADDQC